MSASVIYYSLSGKTKKAAEEYANAHNLPARDVICSFNKLTAWIIGIPKSISRKDVQVTVNTDLTIYKKFIIFMPVWAGNPAAPFNGLLGILPPGTEIELHLTSGSGDTEKTKQATTDYIISKGFKLVGYFDIKT
ncbi:MAG: hypothetical protein LBL87_07150 [Ruminococcus sp.]|jgi:hypothetical protein|nr:hypothetical protein [Ruminococcus sp.]